MLNCRLNVENPSAKKIDEQTPRKPSMGAYAIINAKRTLWAHITRSRKISAVIT